MELVDDENRLDTSSCNAMERKGLISSSSSSNSSVEDIMIRETGGEENERIDAFTTLGQAFFVMVANAVSFKNEKMKRLHTSL